MKTKTFRKKDKIIAGNTQSKYKERYSSKYIVFNNLLLVIIWITAFLGMRKLFNSIFSIIYVFISILFVYFILRKVICANCYYYNKWCNTGWGKLSVLMFKKNSGNKKLGNVLAIIYWFVWFQIVPVIIMIYLSIIKFSYLQISFLIVFVLLQITYIKFRKSCCFNCYNKNTCMGSPYAKRKKK